MPHVINIQDWADDLELFRLPMLNTRLLAEEANRIDADNGHSARITSAQDSANDARDRADTANTRIYQTGLEARIYTDDEIQRLRDELLGRIQVELEERGNEWAEGLEQEIRDRIEEATEHANTVADETRAELATAQSALAVLLGLTNGVIDEDFPLTRAAAEAALLVANNGKAVIDSIFEGFTYPSAMAGIDASFFAANNAELAMEAAEIAALTATDSANSAAGSATVATTKAGEASLSAMAAAASVVRASTGSTKVVPAEVISTNFRHALAGAAGSSGLNAIVVENTGYVTVPNTDTTDVNFVTQTALQWVPGQTYRVQVLARAAAATGALVGVIIQLDGSFATVGSSVTPSLGSLTGSGSWEILSFDYTFPVGSSGTLYFRIGVRTRESVSPDIAIDLQAIVIEDVTQMLAIEGYAEAAVNSSELAAVAQTASEAAAFAASNHVVTAELQADNAADSATAAAGSAFNAEVSRTAAGVSASTASGHAVTATTKAGEAAVSASQAATSAASADGHRVAARASELVAVTARSETVIASGATGFELGLEGWSSTSDGATPLTTAAGWSVIIAKGRGTTLRGPGDSDYFYSARAFHLIPGRRYRVRASMAAGRSATSPGVVRVYAGYMAYDQDGAPIGQRVWAAINNRSMAWSDEWHDAISSTFSLAEVQALRPGAVSVRLVGLMNASRADLNIFGVCDGIWLEDVTDLVEVKASVEQTSVALADLSGAIAGFQWIAKAGPSNGAGIEAVSIAEDGTTTSETLLLHGNVIAPQTISTAQLTVTELDYNKVPDNQLQYLPLWETGNWSIRTPSPTWSADSLGELRWTNDGGTGTSYNTGAPFKVMAGQKLVCGFQMRRISGTQIAGYAVLRFADRDGNLVDGSEVIGSSAANTNSWTQRFEAEVTIPSGAHLAYWRWAVNRNNSNGSIAFFAPSARAKVDGATLITPESITTPLLVANAVTVEKLDMIGLRAVTAWIGNAAIINGSINRAKIQDGEIIRAKIATAAIGEAEIGDLEVTTIKIKGGSLGRSFSARRTSVVDLSSTGDWEDVLSLTMPSNMLPAGAGARVLVSPFVYVRRTSSGDWTIGVRVTVNGSSITTDEYEFGSGTERGFLPVSAVGTIGNGHVIRLQARRAGGVAQSVNHASMTALILFQAS